MLLLIMIVTGYFLIKGTSSTVPQYIAKQDITESGAIKDTDQISDAKRTSTVTDNNLESGSRGALSEQEVTGEIVSSETFQIPVDAPTQDELEALNYTIEQFGLEYAKFEIKHRLFLFEKYLDKDDQTLEGLALTGDMDAAIQLAERSKQANDEQQFLYWHRVAIANGAIGPIFELTSQYRSDPFSERAIQRQEIHGLVSLQIPQSFEISYAWARVGAMRGSYAAALMAADYADSLKPEEVGRGEVFAQRLFQELSADRIVRLGTPFELLDQSPQEAYLNVICGYFQSLPCQETKTEGTKSE